MKKKKIMGIFAHPDDESFGPGGTFAKYAKEGHDIYIFTATKGQAGQASGLIVTKTVGDMRPTELKNAVKTLGVRELILSEFYDGTLNESQLPLLKTQIAREVQRIKPDIIIIFEPGGISQHLDHIAVTKAVLQLYDEKQISPQKLYYYGWPQEAMKLMGREGGIEVQKGACIDVSSVWDIKIKAMKCHETQRADWERILDRSEFLKKEYSSLWQKEFFQICRTSLPDLHFPEKDLLSGIK